MEDDNSDQRAAIRRRVVVPLSIVGADNLPRSLRCVADAPNCGTEEKIGHSGRDDGAEE